MGGKPAPACGFAMGIERILALMSEIEIPSPTTDIYVVHQGEFAADFAWKAAEWFRNEGLTTILHCGGGSFKSQMKKADASGARFAVIVGDDEAAAGVVGLKALRKEAPQVRVAVAEAADLIRKG